MSIMELRLLRGKVQTRMNYFLTYTAERCISKLRQYIVYNNRFSQNSKKTDEMVYAVIKLSFGLVCIHKIKYLQHWLI